MATETLSFSVPSSFPATANGQYNQGGFGNNNATWYYGGGWYRLIFLRQFTPSNPLSALTVTLAASHVSSQRYGAGYYRLNHFRCAIYPATTAFDPWPSADSSGNGKKIDTWAYGGSAATSGDVSFSADSAGNPFTAGTRYYLYVWYYKEQSTNYSSSGNITVSGTGTLQTYTVGYNGNAKSGTTVSNVPAPQTKTAGTDLTLRTTKPTSSSATSSITVTFNANGGSTTKPNQTATKTQPYTFVNWNTAAGGGGTSYASGGKYKTDASATLYAQWTAGTPTYTTVTMPTTSQCIRTGYTLLGFAASPSATTATYSPGTAYTITSAQTLYAVWQIITYPISYNANGGTGAPASQTKTYGVALVLTSSKPTRASAVAATYTVAYNGNGGTAGRASDTVQKTNVFTFRDWNTAANGSGTTYASGANYTANAAATLFAQWTLSSPVGSVTLPSATRTGYTFLGWATSPTATAAQYAAGASYTPSGNVTLYAVWKAQSLVNISNGSAFVPHEIYIANGASFDRYIAYIATGAGWDQYM